MAHCNTRVLIVIAEMQKEDMTENSILSRRVCQMLQLLASIWHPCVMTPLSQNFASLFSLQTLIPILIIDGVGSALAFTAVIRDSIK